MIIMIIICLLLYLNLTYGRIGITCMQNTVELQNRDNLGLDTLSLFGDCPLFGGSIIPVQFSRHIAACTLFSDIADTYCDICKFDQDLISPSSRDVG